MPIRLKELPKEITKLLQDCGIKGYFIEVEIYGTPDGTVIRTLRTIEGSDGKPALFQNEDGTVDSVAVVEEEFEI